MTFDEYFKKYDGKGIDYDGAYGVQCFDLANDYSIKVVGAKAFIGMWAYQIYTDFMSQPGHEFYELIPNTPEFIPQKGDIMVWSKWLNGRAGHVAICNGEGTTKWFNSYDQNWTGCNDPITLIKHNYNYVLGVLRPRDQEKILGLNLGDVDGNGRIDVGDIAKVSAHIKGVNALSKEEQKRADVNKDNKIDVSDIAKISGHIKGISPIK